VGGESRRRGDREGEGRTDVRRDGETVLRPWGEGCRKTKQWARGVCDEGQTDRLENCEVGDAGREIGAGDWRGSAIWEMSAEDGPPILTPEIGAGS